MVEVIIMDNLDISTLELLIAAAEGAGGLFLILIWMQNENKKGLISKLTFFFDQLLDRLDKLIQLIQ